MGKGSFGIVFAITKNNGEKYALKVIETRDTLEINQALREIGNLNNLSGLENILDFKESSVTPFNISDMKFFHLEILMELADYTLKEEIERSPNKRIEENKLLNYVKQIANGLLNASKKNFAHMDLKPGNILIFNNIAKIADWGGSVFIKKSANGSISLDKSQEDIAFSTAFSSPEFLEYTNDDSRNKKLNFFLCDIYSFGILVLNCCGITLFEIKKITKFHTSSAGHDKDIKFLVDKIKEFGYSEEILKIIEKMCKYNPGERYTIESLVQELK